MPTPLAPSFSGRTSDSQTDPRFSSILDFRFAVILVFLFLGLAGCLLLPLPIRGRIGHCLADLLHGPAFMALTFFTLWFANYRVFITLLISLVITLAIIAAGTLLECLQPYSGRTFSVLDIVANTTGAVAGWLLFFVAKQDRKASHRRKFIQKGLASLLALGLLGGGMLAGMRDLSAALAQRRIFPQLGSFESKAELSRWHRKASSLSLNPRQATEGQFALQIDIPADAYPGISLFHAPENWEAYDDLEFDIVMLNDETAPADALETETIIRLRIDDHLFKRNPPDGFFRTFSLTPLTPQHIVVPLPLIREGSARRELDLRRIRMLELLSLHERGTVRICIDDMRLTKRKQSTVATSNKPKNAEDQA